MRRIVLSVVFASVFALAAHAQSLGLDEFKPSADAYAGCYDPSIYIDEASREKLISMRALCMLAKVAMPEDSANINQRIATLDKLIDKKKKSK